MQCILLRALAVGYFLLYPMACYFVSALPWISHRGPAVVWATEQPAPIYQAPPSLDYPWGPPLPDYTWCEAELEREHLIAIDGDADHGTALDFLESPIDAAATRHAFACGCIDSDADDEFVRMDCDYEAFSEALLDHVIDAFH